MGIYFSAGRACTLKEEDTDVEERAGAARRRTRRRTRSHKSHSEGEVRGCVGVGVFVREYACVGVIERVCVCVFACVCVLGCMMCMHACTMCARVRMNLR